LFCVYEMGSLKTEVRLLDGIYPVPSTWEVFPVLSWGRKRREMEQRGELIRLTLPTGGIGSLIKLVVMMPVE
jgi:hypothetical protein